MLDVLIVQGQTRYIDIRRMSSLDSILRQELYLLLGHLFLIFFQASTRDLQCEVLPAACQSPVFENAWLFDKSKLSTPEMHNGLWLLTSGQALMPSTPFPLAMDLADA